MTYSIVLCMDSLPKLPVPLADFISIKIIGMQIKQLIGVKFK